jgi:hypothetical protein
MRIDRDAAAVVADGEKAVGRQFHFDEGCVTGQRLVHRVVDHFGEQVVQRPFVGAANVHARPPADRLKSFQNLDIGCGVAGLSATSLRRRSCGSRFRGRLCEQVVGLRFLTGLQWLVHVSSSRLGAGQRANR